MPNLPISRLINVSVNLSPLAAQAQNLNTLLILGASDVIDVVTRLRTYSTLAAVAADFGTSAIEYLAAVLWFEQNPQPVQLKIGRWAQGNTAGKLFGAAISAANQAIALWNAIITPGFSVFIDSVPKTITPESFAASTNLNGIATLIQTALPGGVTCVWNSNFSRFEFESSTQGASSSISFLKPPTAFGSITFAVNPANNDTITLNGTVVTFKSAGPVGNQVLIGGTLAATLVNLLAFLAASVDVQIVKMTYTVLGGILYIVAVTPGVGGNALTIAASVAAVSGATLSGGSGTDISGMLAALSTSSGAYVANGIVAETAVAAATLFDTQFGQSWYALMIPQAVDTDHLAVAAYIEASVNKHLYGVTSQEAGVISSASTTDIAYLLSQLLYNKTVVQYSSSNPYAVASLLGRAITIDYNGNSTVITLMYKQEPGITAESLNATQIAALEAKNCNVFVAYNNNTAIVEPGVVSSGQFIDTITGTDWLAVTIMTALYNLLYTSTTKIPQNDAGMHLLTVTAQSILVQAVANGLLAAGVWNANGFGALHQGDFMPSGFYIFMPPVASQSAADRAARKSTTMQIAAKLAGAVHDVNVIINVNQ